MDWYVDYWKSSGAVKSSVERDLVGMIKSNRAAQHKLRKLIRGVEEFGPYGYTMPNNENLNDGLFELRDTTNHYRYYYCETDFCYKMANGSKNVVLLMLLAESNKDRQKSHILKAKERMKSICENNLLNKDSYEICLCED